MYFNSGLHPCSPGSHPPAHWAWAASLDSATLPDLPHIACVNRIPRSLLIDVTEALAPILRALRKDRTNVAANNMLWLFPHLVLRKDAVKSDNAQGRRMSSRVRERYNAIFGHQTHSVSALQLLWPPCLLTSRSHFCR